MSDPTDDQIRDLLHRAMADAPQPHPWAVVRARADVHAARPVGVGRRVGYWLAGAACTIGLIAGLVVLMDPDDNVRIDEEPVPSAPTTTLPSGTTSTTTTSTTPTDELGSRGAPSDNVVAQFIAALNDRDLAALEVVSSDDLSFDGVVPGERVDEWPALMAWYEAFDWRWEEATCRVAATSSDIVCELFERNRLTDITDTERPATVSFTLVDGQVDAVRVGADLDDYGSNAFNPFRAWVQLNHPGDVALMWTLTNSPLLTAESATLFDQHLTEYTARLRDEVASAERFLEALDARDLTALQAVSSEDLTVDQIVFGNVVDEWPSLTTWYEAFDGRWEDATCQVTSIASDVACDLFEWNPETDARRPTRVSFRVVDGRVAAIEIDADRSDG